MNRDKPEELVARVPFSTVLASVVGLWAAYLILMTLRAELLNLHMAGDLLGLRALSSLMGAVVTLALWLVLRAFDARPLWAKITAALVFALPAALLIAQVNWLIFADVQAALDEKLLQDFVQSQGIESEETGVDIRSSLAAMFSSSSREQVTELTFSRYFMLLAWCALYLALLTGEKARGAERREQQFRNAAKAAELRSLRYQVNPHFLFNTLNSLSALVLTGKTQAAERMIQMISTFYRRSLADDPTADLPLAEEIALQKLYLDIEAVRFPLRLRAEYNIPRELEDCLVPGMILQPLVENSVKHAVAPTTGQVVITLSAREEYGRLVVTVADNGDGSTENGDPRPGYGIGLANVRERLEARFGDEASLVSGRVPEGYATHLRLPIQRGHRRQEAAE
ncbi:sensor histidine kinase [Alteraurantiacibacter aquimixticola]|nr:histidine kinase [Alteraurantiacibacter aquimixticola]